MSHGTKFYIKEGTIFEYPDRDFYTIYDHEVEWKPNRLMIFCGESGVTWHDYKSDGKMRFTYNYFLVDPTKIKNEVYKTLYLGCESTEIATPENHIIRFDKGTVFPHPTIMDKLCTPMWEQQYMADWRVIDGPMKYCVILPHWANTKVKPENASTGYETIEWFLQNMHPPKHGAIFSLYEYEQINHYLTGKWSAQVIWPLRKEYQWTGTGTISLYTTLNLLH